MGVSKARAIEYPRNPFAKMSEKSWGGKGLSLSAPKYRCVFWLFYHQMTTNSTQSEGEGAYESTQDQLPPDTLVYQINRMLPHSSGTDQLLACIPVLIFLAYLYHSTFYPSTKNKKFSRWTFPSLTHVSWTNFICYMEKDICIPLLHEKP